ncbi:MAG: hypothetical protein ACC657_16420 [Thiohalomonadales bacterium]
MRTNKNKLITLILIFMLFVFQNTWAIEQTYLMLCQTTQDSMGKAPMAKEKMPMANEQCPDCCDMYASYEQLTTEFNLDNLPTSKTFKAFSFEQFYSIFNQPPLPPPIS